MSPCRGRNRTSNWKLTRGEVTVLGLRAPPRPARSRWSPDWPAEEGAGPEGLLGPGAGLPPGLRQPRHPRGSPLAAAFVGSAASAARRCPRIPSPGRKPGCDASFQEQRDFLHDDISFSRTLS